MLYSGATYVRLMASNTTTSPTGGITTREEAIIAIADRIGAACEGPFTYAELMVKAEVEYEKDPCAAGHHDYVIEYSNSSDCYIACQYCDREAPTTGGYASTYIETPDIVALWEDYYGGDE